LRIRVIGGIIVFKMREVYRIFLILAFILFSVSNSLGADLSLTAKVNKNELNLGENFELTIEIRGNFRITPKIELPDLKDFEIISRQSSYNFNIKGGEFLNQTKFIFVLKSKSEGKFIIGEAKVRYKGRDYKTEPIEITVLPAKEELPKKPEKKYPTSPKITL